MVFFVVIGNWILEIQGMWWQYWLILFSLSCFANLLGLNISASFNSVKVIYILIPILIIPQLLFSGVIVKFDKLNPLFGDESAVPLIGNVMASRWAYEALAVEQFTGNEYGQMYFSNEKWKSFGTWKKDYWLQELNAKMDFVKTNLGNIATIEETKQATLLIQNEIEREENFVEIDRGGIKEFLLCGDCMETSLLSGMYPEIYGETNKVKRSEVADDYVISPESNVLATLKTERGVKYLFTLDFGSEDVKNEFISRSKVPENALSSSFETSKLYFGILKDYYKKIVETYRTNIDNMNKEIIDKYGKEKYLDLIDNQTNDALEQFVTNKTDLTKLVESEGYLIQKSDPIYLDPYDKYFWDAQFYAPKKKIKMLNIYVSTFWANISVIWLMSIILIVTLYFDALKKLLDGMEKLFEKIKFKKSEPK
jgi:hypothetical protein